VEKSLIKVYRPREAQDEMREMWEARWAEQPLDERYYANILHWSAYPRLFHRYLSGWPGFVLEAGCGLGRYVRYFHQQGWPAVGLDYTISSLARVHDFDDTLQLTGGDVRRLPFASETFAAYVSLGVVEHFEDIAQRDRALSEAWRVLRPGGLAFVAVPHQHLISRLRGKPPEESEGLFYQYLLTPDEAREMLADAGFVVLDTLLSNKIKWFLDSKLGKYLVYLLRRIRRRQGQVDEVSGGPNDLKPQESTFERSVRVVAQRINHLLPGSVFGHMVAVIAAKPD
jgi:SAM-dependent methyltransferase